MKTVRGFASALLVCGLFAACGGGGGSPPEAGVPVCAQDPRGEQYQAGMHKTGSGGTRVQLVESRPGPPVKGNHTWIVQVTDANGTSLDNLTIKVTPYMPDHRHGTSIKAVVTPISGGRYEIAPVNLFMASLWQVTLALDLPGGKTDSVVFSFCIDG